MIRLALLIALFMIPAAILSAIILAIYPHIPEGLMIVGCCGIIIGGAFAYVKKRKRFFEEQDNLENMPAWLTKSSYRIFLVIGTLLGSVAMFSYNKTQFYIDNGSDKAITVNLKYEGKFTVAPHSYETKTVVIGENEVEYNGIKKVFNISSHGNWVWNVDTLNSYIRSSVKYSSEQELYKDKKEIPKEETPDFKIITAEFFYANVDYMFDAPKSISVERGSSSKDVKKTVLYRINGNDDFGTDETNNASDSTKNVRGEIIDEPTKK